MKLYNVHLQIVLSEIGDPDKVKSASELAPLTEGMSKDSPVREVAMLVERLQERGMFPGLNQPYPILRMPGSEGSGDGMNMHHDFQVAIGSFAEMQDVLLKFRQVCDALSMPVDR
jgi:hypothetical protein